MPDIDLTVACWDYDRTRALQDGRVKVEGVNLTYLPMMMPESFFRMLRFGDFDASEMSLGWYTRTVEQDPRPFVAIPVFPSRMFRHSSIYVNVDSGIESPADLRGKRIGCPEYQMTAAVWIKGIMSDQYGVAVDDVTYHTGGLEQPGREETPLDLPDHISVTPIPTDRTLSDMLEKGEVDAVYTAHMPSSFARRSPKVRRLFEDPVAVEKEYFRETGIFPIMHTVVISAAVLERTPWVAQSLQKAFEASKRITYADLFETTALKTSLPWMNAAAEEARELGGDDFWPYGFDANEETLKTFVRYHHEQGLTRNRVDPRDMFVPSTLEASKI
jgi:4,5-dihydroxyphthalate decarboxylase